jgi:outer membrane protein assembly factor BamB
VQVRVIGTRFSVSRSGDEASKKAFRSAWQSWWAKNSAKVNLADLHKEAPLLGHTVIVLLDLGQILELNKKNEIVWKIQGVVFPLDVQTLPNGNVLVAEYHAGKVTERDKVRGEIKWEKSVNGPLVAQRLANRHTFVGTDSQVFEFDEKGNEVFAFGLPNGERFMKVAKLASGDIAALTSESRIVRLDAKGKELHSFNVPLSARLFGGRIHMLPNGRVIVPHNQENKVVEYDMDGNIVWEVSVPQPVAATRLPNGHTLVTTMQPQTGAIEFDRQGREVWTYRHTTRVTRAIRR